jgi:hypothetical protein
MTTHLFVCTQNSKEEKKFNDFVSFSDIKLLVFSRSQTSPVLSFSNVKFCFWCLIFISLFVVNQLSSCVTAQSGITQTTATLSEARYQLAATSSGELVFFGGGNATTGPSGRVDICNVTSGIWTTANLSVPREELAATSLGNLVFFAGGYDGANYYSQVDIYNTSDGTWNTSFLSRSRYALAATSVGNLVFFAGGCCSSNVVDIYNMTNRIWATATLSQARYNLAATSVANRFALFAGGYDGLSYWNVVDFYDQLSGRWYTTELSQARAYLAATSIGNLVFFGGGQTNFGQASNIIDIFDPTTLTWNVATLSQNRTQLAAASIGEIVAFGGGTPDGSTPSSVVDMYNVTSGIWFPSFLTQSRYLLAACASTNHILFGGGYSQPNGYFYNVEIFTVPSVTNPLGSVPSTFQPTVTTAGTAVSQPTVNTLVVTPFSASSTNTLIIGAVLGALFGALIIVGAIVLIVLLKKRKKKKTQLRESVPAGIRSFEQQSSGTTRISFVSHENRQIPQTDESLLNVEPTKYQILFSDLEILREIGKGCYGRVCLGRWRGSSVALKFCKEKEGLDSFMKEADLMINLPPHPNVVRMFGISIDGPQPVIILEYCAGGNSFLFVVTSAQDWVICHRFVFGNMKEVWTNCYLTKTKFLATRKKSI